jgi:hypothetical protein
MCIHKAFLGLFVIVKYKRRPPEFHPEFGLSKTSSGPPAPMVKNGILIVNTFVVVLM